MRGIAAKRRLVILWTTPLNRSVLHSQWTVGIAGGIVATVVGGLLLDAWKVISLDPVWAFAVSVWRWLMGPVTISRLLLGLLGVGLFAFLVLMFLAWWQSRQPEPTWRTHYNADTFFNVRWRWRYDTLNQLDPDSVSAFCPQCEGRLIPTRQSHYRAVPETGLNCSICDFKEAFQGDVQDLHHQVALRIEQRVNSGGWRAAAGLTNAKT
jgi:hypothetical protein